MNYNTYYLCDRWTARMKKLQTVEKRRGSQLKDVNVIKQNFLTSLFFRTVTEINYSNYTASTSFEQLADGQQHFVIIWHSEV